MNKNRVIISGYVGGTVEVREHENFTSANFSVGTNEFWIDKNSGEKQKRVDWHKVEAHNRHAEKARELLSKGQGVYIEGKLRTESWDDLETNTKRYKTYILVTEIQVFSKAESLEKSFQKDDDVPY